MKNTEITLSPDVEKQLNSHQIRFIKMAYQRIFFIEKNLDYEITPPHIRLLYLKELFTIFEELHKIKFARSNEGKMSLQTKQTLDEMKLIVAFIRNVVSHFPLFNTWDDIWISQDFSVKMGGTERGKIFKFLKHNEQRIPIAVQVIYKNNSVRQANFNYPQHLEQHQVVYLKDIISEEDGAIIVLAIMSEIF